jgi:ABC-type antimicrobial peptide transport system permease subunit
MLRFGPLVVTAVSWSDVAVSVLIAVGTGCLLSVGGALYPALLAARMQPVDAMRAEH